jgi:hypothetical protein
LSKNASMPRWEASAYSTHRARKLPGSSDPAPVSQAISARTLAGWTRARLSAMLPPMESPHTAAGSAPRCSSSAWASATDAACEYAVGVVGASERPKPRQS